MCHHKLVRWLNHTSLQPPESLVRRQSLLLPTRKRSMLILMADTSLSRSPLRPWTFLTHQLASSCRISVGKFPRVQGKPEKRAFCFKDARCWCNVSMPYCFMTVYHPMTAPTECSYQSLYFPYIFKLPRDYSYRGSKIIIYYDVKTRGMFSLY